MEILFVTSDFGSHENIGYMPLVGAELARRGHDVRGLQYEAGSVLDAFPIDRIPTRELYTPYWFGQWLFYRDWTPKVRSYLSNENPDVVVTDRRCMAPTLLAGSELGIPTVGVVPGLGFTRFDPYDHDRCKDPSFRSAPGSVKLQYPFVRRLFEWHERALRAASEVVVISDFLRDVLAETFGCQSRVIRTPVPLDEFRVEDVTPRYLAVVNPRTLLKGSELTVRIAERLSEREFLVAGEFAEESHRERAERLDNVRHLGWVDDMRRVYRESSLVLVPSLVEEGGGPRVVIEGFVNGIPAVGTDRGAVPEHVADAGRIVSDPHDVDDWETAVQQALEQRDTLSQRAREQAERYEAADRVDDFEAVLESVAE